MRKSDEIKNCRNYLVDQIRVSEMVSYSWQHGWRGWRACVGEVLAWLRGWLCQHEWRGWRSKVISVGHIVGNTRLVSQTVSWMAHYFLNLFQMNIAGNEYCSKLEKEFRFQVIFTSNVILLFRVSPGYLNLSLH